MPGLTVQALQKHISSRKLAPMYVLVGEDVQLVERLVDGIEATVDEGDRPFAVERVYATDPGGEPIDIASAARIRPMLGDRRIVIVLRAERLLKPKRAQKSADADEADADAEEAGAVDLAPLEDYVDAPNDESTVVFVATETDKTRRFTKRLLEKAHVVVCGGLTTGDNPRAQDTRAAALNLLRDELAAAGRAIEPAALALLADRAGDDISKLRGDLERLLLYTDGQARITRDDVAEVTSQGSIEDPWAITNALADGDTARALREVNARLERGDSPHAMLGQLRWWVATKLADGDPDRVKPAIDAVLRTDLAMKSSGGDETVLLERLVVELAGKRLPPSKRAWG